MTFEHVVAFFIFSAVAAGTPGPSNTLLTATGARVGVVRGLPAVLGVAAGMGSMLFVVALGLGSVILGQPHVMSLLKWCGAAFLLWMAWRIATASVAHGEAHGDPVGFVGAATFQLVNPKAWLVWTSAAATFLEPEAGSALVQSSMLGIIFAVACIPSCVPWLAFGAALRGFLRSERAARIFNVAMGALLAASVALFIW